MCRRGNNGFQKVRAKIWCHSARSILALFLAFRTRADITKSPKSVSQWSIILKNLFFKNAILFSVLRVTKGVLFLSMSNMWQVAIGLIHSREK